MMRIKSLYKNKGNTILGWLLALGIGLSAISFYESYTLAIPRVAGDFMAVWVICMAFDFSKKTAADSKSSASVLYLKALFWCAVIAALAAYSMGSHYEDADPLFGGGTRVIDYVPSDQQRTERFWWLFLILISPAASGIHRGSKSRNVLSTTT
jgi:hypothetical protein